MTFVLQLVRSAQAGSCQESNLGCLNQPQRSPDPEAALQRARKEMLKAVMAPYADLTLNGLTHHFGWQMESVAVLDLLEV